MEEPWPAGTVRQMCEDIYMTQEAEQDAVYELSNGVKVRLRKMSPVLLAQVATTVGQGEPKVPVSYNEDKERDEDNPLDPDYVADHNRWAAGKGIRLLRTLVAAATTLEHKPDGIMAPESQDFAEFMELMEIPLATSEQGRYTQWVMYLGVQDEDEMKDFSAVLMRMAGAREEDVADAQALFRGEPERTTDNGASSVGNRRDRRALQRSAGRARTGDGGA